MKQEEREAKYQEIIISLTKQLNITIEIKEDIKTIKAHILKQ
ncbi:hypothetical protein L7E55_01265 [Pelotomaculum isophthalicicum JI]|uniref:Uncharacterized protein n=1 Tax=Pelotomaculum isophthalicicum JI TaxID=947010 RepID=A0A9X4JUV1_9FIRM|nr:hypothetical protein [Pelotomaculum isophthalicicum JI]